VNVRVFGDIAKPAEQQNHLPSYAEKVRPVHDAIENGILRFILNNEL